MDASSSSPARWRRQAAWALGLVALVALAACAGRPRGPEDTVREVAKALREGRWERAYAHLDESYRRRVTLEEFRRHLEAHPDEVRHLAGLLGHASGAQDVSATVALPDGDALVLVRDGSDWRIRGNALDFYDQSSPRAAIRAFVRAMERRRYDVVLRLVPNADREGMSEERMRESFEGEAREEIDRLLAALREGLSGPIEVVGERATLSYGDGATVQLLREDGVWKIEDPD
ncbi:MAG: hypothetical protein KF901_33515 [Myxococcales bacterium]|nr:hypothetical protein [Myxococcales bacterium]